MLLLPAGVESQSKATSLTTTVGLQTVGTCTPGVPVFGSTSSALIFGFLVTRTFVTAIVVTCTVHATKSCSAPLT